MMEQWNEKVRDFFNNNDLFCANNRIRITRIEAGQAWGELEAEYNLHANGGGVVQGGALYTLADFVFAAAACSCGIMAVTMNSSVSFIRPGKMGKILAEAREINRGRQTGIYEVDLHQEEDGKLLLHAVMTAFFTEQPLFPEQQS